MDNELDIRLQRIEQTALLAAKNVLSLKEAAQIMGRSEKTVRNRLDEIPHYHGPLGVMFKRDELESWMCQVRINPMRI